MPAWLVPALAVAACVATLAAATGIGFAGALTTVLADGAVSVLIFVAAAGWGWLVVRPLVPAGTPAGLVAVTSCGAGLWLLSTAMLALGSLAPGGLSAWIWWPVVVAGAAIAALVAIRQATGNRQRATGEKQQGNRMPPDAECLVPGASSYASLWWLLPAVALGLALAGATLPAPMVGRANADFYDVLEYHLQVPREFLANGHIGLLTHNVYSNYPLGGEMIFLLSMILRGGAYAGMYTAQLTHVLWGVLAVAALAEATGNRQQATGEKQQGNRVPPDAWCLMPGASPCLLACAPLVVYLGFLAFVELAELACLAIGLAWLRVWLGTQSTRAAAMVGLAAGVACANKYLSVGLVAGPLMLVLGAVAVWRFATAPRENGGRRHEYLSKPVGGFGRRFLARGGESQPRWRPLVQFALAGVLCAVAMAPWLVRNVVNTGNPVFPLATGIFGRGYWSAASEARWLAGHASPSLAAKPAHLLEAAQSPYGIGLPLAIAFAAAAVWLLTRRRGARPLDWACLAIVAVQVAVWAMATHMPGRFLAPALVPMALLAGGLIGRIAGTRCGEDDAPHPARRVVAAALLAVLAISQLALAWHVYGREPFARQGFQGVTMDDLRDSLAGPWEKSLGPDTRLLEVGNAKAWLSPPGTLYGTVFDGDPLSQAVQRGESPRQILDGLRRAGVTHIRVDWREIDRLGRTYGWWPGVDRELFARLVQAGLRPMPPDDTQVGREMFRL